MSTTIPELHLGISGLRHSLHCETCLCGATEFDELELRRLHVLDEGLLELELHGHRDSTTGARPSTAPSICIPPWAGGGPPPVVGHQADHGELLLTRQSEAPHRVDEPAHDLHSRALPDLLEVSKVSEDPSRPVSTMPTPPRAGMSTFCSAECCWNSG